VAEQYGRLDPWRAATTVEVAQAREMAALLERRGGAADEIAARSSYLDLLAVRPGERALEVGCGNGIVLCDLARRVGPDGLAVGLDPSPAFLAIAHERADRAGLGDRIELREGDARVLPFDDGQFDVIVAATTLAHVPEGHRAIQEMVRVAGPSGRVGVLEQDTDSYLVTHPDRALTRRIVATYTDHGYADGWLARRLPRLLSEAGLRDVRVRAFASLDTDPTGFYSTRAERAADVAARAGAISEQEHQGWLNALHAEQASGAFVAGITLLFAWGTRLPTPDG
jgi:ubiquinone/menaquinone biosynthesis C-methylase UbiE